jgi:hypothetical protein
MEEQVDGRMDAEEAVSEEEERQVVLLERRENHGQDNTEAVEAMAEAPVELPREEEPLPARLNKTWKKVARRTEWESPVEMAQTMFARLLRWRRDGHDMDQQAQGLMESILKSFPSLAKQEDRHGYIPLHIALSYKAPFAIIKMLFDAHPAGILNWKSMHRIISAVEDDDEMRQEDSLYLQNRLMECLHYSRELQAFFFKTVVRRGSFLMLDRFLAEFPSFPKHKADFYYTNNPGKNALPLHFTAGCGPAPVHVLRRLV